MRPARRGSRNAQTADAREEIVHLNTTVALGAGPGATDGPLAAGEPELRHDIGHSPVEAVRCAAFGGAPKVEAWMSKLGFGFMRIAQIAPWLKVFLRNSTVGQKGSLRGSSMSS